MEPRMGVLPLAEEEWVLKNTTASHIYNMINNCYDLRVKDNGDIVIVRNRRRE